MGTLVSPGVSITITNESFFIPVSASTVPLFFIATNAGKTQPNGVTPAAGTLEHSVVRTVTSLKQSMALYGVPSFRNDISKNEFHGDARNEYGLFALNQFLGVGNRAFVVRANIDLTDKPVKFMSLGTPEHGTISYNGIGTGGVINITAAGPDTRPQLITITFTDPSTFSVTGSVTGYIGTGLVGFPFKSTTLDLTITSGTTPFVIGDKFQFNLSYSAASLSTNAGNGRVISLIPDSLAIPETVTISFTSPTSYNVSGTITGPSGSGIVNSPFDNHRVNFTIINGSAPFAAGDEFSFDVTEITVSAPLGVNDASKRVAICMALQAQINSNTEVRSPLYEYNLIVCPGYHEVVDELLALSVAIKEEALVIADTPADKTSEQVAQWGLTSERLSNTSVAYYYPWGLASNLDGRNVLCAPSGIALRTIAYSDNAGFVWTAPAGVTRGVVTGVAKVGYYTGTPGTPTTFIESNLNDGQLDNLYEYDKNINPITFFPGRGLLVWGQKTSAPVPSALDRINAVRLVMYLRRALRKGALPFVFEVNDQITRANLKGMADGILGNILANRGLYDFATISDESNNTPDRIDRNELWLDVAIKIAKTAEFIYIPIKIVSTSAEI